MEPISKPPYTDRGERYRVEDIYTGGLDAMDKAEAIARGATVDSLTYRVADACWDAAKAIWQAVDSDRGFGIVGFEAGELSALELRLDTVRRILNTLTE